MRQSDLKRAFALLSLVTIVSCDSGGDGTFTLTITEASVSINQGVKDTIAISLARAGFDKDIALTVQGLPVGVTAVFTPAPVPGNVSTVALELTVAATATLGTTTLTVRANAAGKTEQVATTNLTVALTGTYTLSSHGFPVTAAQGGGASGAILVVRADGHGDNVTLAAGNLPTGVTASFAASPTSTIGTALSFAVAAGAAPGSYPITITGTAPGLTDRTTQVTLNVISPPATASFSMPFCAGAIPVWFAYQNTGYPWQVVTPVSGVFTFQATPAVAVAYTYVTNTAQVNETDLNVYYATRTELAGKDNRDCAGPKTLTGSVAGATSGQTTNLTMGPVDTTATFSSPNFTLKDVPDRPLDLMAVKGSMTSSAITLLLVPELLLIQRGLNPATGSSVGTLDFPGQGFAPASTNLTIANIGTGDNLNIGNSFWSATSTYGIIHSFQPTTATNGLFSMPAAKFQAGDLQELLVETFSNGFSFGRVNVAYLGAITGDRTETLPAQLATPTASALVTSPYVRMRGQLAVQADYPTATRFIFFQDGGNSADRLVYVVVTAAYLGATPASNWEVTIPEFGSVSGLNNNWLPSTSFLLYQAEAYASPGPVLFGAIPAQGDMIKVAYRVTTTGSLLRAGSNAPAFRASLRREIESRQYLRR